MDLYRSLSRTPARTGKTFLSKTVHGLAGAANLGPNVKYSIFGFELSTLSKELRIVSAVCEGFKKMQFGKETLFQCAGSMDEAAKTIDLFKAKTCGSAYDLALININSFPSEQDLAFLLGSNVLGDPRSVFVVSLKNIKGPLYSMVREKIERESGQIAQGLMPGAPSCIDSYSSATRPETAERVAKILSAQLEDEELREKARQEGALPPALSVAAELMRNSSTVFFGRRLGCISGFFPKLPADEKTPPPRKTPGFTRESGRMG